MTVSISILAGAAAQFFDNNGVVLSGGKIYTYAAGTTTPLATYTSLSGSIANSNPIVLDANGRTPYEIWLTNGSSYKFVLKDVNDTLIGTYDNISGANDVSSVLAELANTSNNALGDALIGFCQSNSSGFIAGAVARTVNAKLQEIVSVLDFGADPTGVADSTAAFNQAIATGCRVNVPAGTYSVANIGVVNSMYIDGDSIHSTFLEVNTNGAAAFLNDALGWQWTIANMTIQAKSGVTNAKGFYQPDKVNYSAYVNFVNIETNRNLKISYEGFFIYARWDNCRDGYEGSPVVGQYHQGINSNPATYGQPQQTNLNQIHKCQFFNSSDPTGAVNISYGANWAVYDTDFELNTTYAMTAYGIFGLSFNNCWFENNAGTSVVVVGNSPSPNVQGTRPVTFNNCWYAGNAANQYFLYLGGASSGAIVNWTGASIPAGFSLSNQASLIEMYGIIPLSGSGAVNAITGMYADRYQVQLRNSEATTNFINSPQTQNQNVLPIGPAGLGASNFTALGAMGAITNIGSQIGLSGQAVQFTLGGTANAAYYQIPAKLAKLLRGKTLTLAATGYASVGGTGEIFQCVIWDSVSPSTTNASNNTLQTTITISPTGSTDLQMAYTVTSVSSASTSLCVGFYAGGNAPTQTVAVEAFKVLLGEIKPDFVGLY